MNLKQITTLFAVLLSFNLQAQEQSDLKFNDGSVIAICSAINSKNTLTTEIFNESFPRLIINLQRYLDKGKLKRAHYLGSLKEGIFMVVDGVDKKDALINATAIVNEQLKIIEDAYDKKNVPIEDRHKGASLLEFEKNRLNMHKRIINTMLF